MSSELLKNFVRASDIDDDFIDQCWDEAVALVSTYAGTNDVPTAVLTRCYIECGSELFHRRSAPMGVSQFASMDGQAVRVARDPLLGVYPLLRPYVGLGGIG
jgi:hypothetical protein